MSEEETAVRALMGQIKHLETQVQWLIQLLGIAVDKALRCPFCGTLTRDGVHKENCDYIAATNE